MLRLDAHRLAAIERALLAERIAELLRAHFPQTAGTMDIEALVDQAASQATRAQSYGLLDGPQVFRFVLAAWILGDGFDERVAPLRALLGDAALAPAERADRLMHSVLDALAALSQDAPLASDGLVR